MLRKGEKKNILGETFFSFWVEDAFCVYLQHLHAV